MDLIRCQNLTSARILTKQSDSDVFEVPEASESLRLNFENITPYKTFQLDQE